MNPALMNPNALAMMAMQAQMGGAPVQAPPQQPAPSIPRALMVPPSPTASGRMRAAIKKGAPKKSGGNRRQSGAAK